jgi:hypothetical protein
MKCSCGGWADTCLMCEKEPHMGRCRDGGDGCAACARCFLAEYHPQGCGKGCSCEVLFPDLAEEKVSNYYDGTPEEDINW